jgi:hypothetical protein
VECAAVASLAGRAFEGGAHLEALDGRQEPPVDELGEAGRDEPRPELVPRKTLSAAG